MNNQPTETPGGGTAGPVRLTVVSGGLSQPSSTRMLADRLAGATGEALRSQGRTASTHTVELRDLATDIARGYVTGFPGHTLGAELTAVSEADGLIAVTPVFNASYSGLFKSFFDVLEEDALAGKPVLLAATGGSPRHSLVLEHALRPLFTYLRALTVPTGVFAATADWGAQEGPGPSLPGRIARAGGELAGLLRERPGAAPAPTEPVVPFEQQLAALRPPE
ncbi:oxidoreductase [Streptomyces sp. AJS327]|uniref:FMN reductase n=1 Tax=Streptomyces sp. AJS327 TaxID=2545265 RepID=UPI0015DE9D32|nr:FMN reductase [Streptomyces sp. AJS327]MBA0050105.1 oxidoreductase [Streptomyces sp. AJS327]